MDRTIHDAPGAVKAENVVRHGARAPRLLLVLVPEQALPRVAAAIVEFAVGEHAQQRRFASVHVANHGDTAECGARAQKYDSIMLLTKVGIRL